MTEQEANYFKQKGTYNDIILTTNLTMVYSYIMYFALIECIEQLGSNYKFSLKYNLNKVLNILDKINVSNIDKFTNSKNEAGQMCIDISNDIENSIYFDDKYFYILLVCNEFLLTNIHKYLPEVHSIFESEIEYMNKLLKSTKIIDIDNGRFNVVSNIIKNIINKVKYKEDNEYGLIILYDNDK